MNRILSKKACPILVLVVEKNFTERCHDAHAAHKQPVDTHKGLRGALLCVQVFVLGHKTRVFSMGRPGDRGRDAMDIEEARRAARS